MRKFMKYEIKGTYKFILGILAVVIIASSIIQINIKSNLANGMDPMNQTSLSTFNTFLMVVAVLVIFAAFIVAFFYTIGSFKKELYEDRGFLTFTLPLTGNQILGGKLLVAVLWFATFGIVSAGFNFILAMSLFDENILQTIKTLLKMVNSGAISIGFVSIISIINTLILIYLSMALSRVTIRNKKIGGMWFIIYLVLNALTGYLFIEISKIAPYYLNLRNFQMLGYNQLQGLQYMSGNMENIVIFGNNAEAYINIVGILSQILFSTAAFITTGYIIEKKIDL